MRHYSYTLTKVVLNSHKILFGSAPHLYLHLVKRIECREAGIGFRHHEFKSYGYRLVRNQDILIVDDREFFGKAAVGCGNWIFAMPQFLRW